MRRIAVCVLTVGVAVSPVLVSAGTQDPAALQLACSGGDAKSCFDLGVLYEGGNGVPKDKAKAAGFYRKACDAGSAGGCFALGLMYKWGKGVPQNRAKATEFYQKACDAGLAAACDAVKKDGRATK
jgi:TPR repeat protein